jgi:transcriptional regulator with XRE-family HTH domain
MNLAEQFVRSRELSGKTVRQLAAAAGLPEEEVWRAESGNRNLELGSLTKLARALGCRLELVSDPVERLVNETTEDPDLMLAVDPASEVEPEGETVQAFRHLKRVNGEVMLKGTRISLKQLLQAFADDLSVRELTAGSGVPRAMVREALRELAGMVDRLPIEPATE